MYELYFTPVSLYIYYVGFASIVLNCAYARYNSYSVSNASILFELWVTHISTYLYLYTYVHLLREVSYHSDQISCHVLCFGQTIAPCRNTHTVGT